MKSFYSITLMSWITFFCQARQAMPMEFTSSESSFDNDTEQYKEIWNKEGKRITETLVRFSGLEFEDKKVSVIVFEGGSNSGYKEKPMKLRASYPENTKKGTLVHELGHRLQTSLKHMPRDFNEHNLLFLYLYDVWVELYGESFANEQVAIESKRKNPRNDYKSMWEEALSHSKEKRKELLKELIDNYK